MARPKRGSPAYWEAWEKKQLLGLRSPEQREIMKRYFEFTPEKRGCSRKVKEMSNKEYVDKVWAKISTSVGHQRALQKLGLHESQANEIKPVLFWGFVKDKDDPAIFKKAGCTYTSRIEVTWLFFGDEELSIYKCIFDMVYDTQTEDTIDYFYTDITAFESKSVLDEFAITVAGKGCRSKKLSKEKVFVKTNIFSVVVPGDNFTCSMTNNPEMEAKIQGMKQILREKKREGTDGHFSAFKRQ